MTEHRLSVGLERIASKRRGDRLVVAFSGVIMLIADLDRPEEGFVRVSQQPMVGPAGEHAGGCCKDEPPPPP